jgi:hypothetical protein
VKESIFVAYVKIVATKFEEKQNLSGHIHFIYLKLSSSGVDDSLWEKFYDLLRKQLTSAETVALVIDDNMFYTSMRHRYFQLARKCKFKPGKYILKHC